MDKLDQLSDSGTNTFADPRPSPADFATFLPWACGQLQLSQNVVVKKVLQNDYVSVQHDRYKAKTKSKAKHSVIGDITSDQNTAAKSDNPVGSATVSQDANTVKISAVYSNEHLVHIKFENNVTIPRLVLIIIELIIQFHSQVHTITMTSGLDKYTLYELSKIVSHAHITDVCLDGTFVKEANYHLILDNTNQLRNLSLSRCKIDDRVVKAIADKLEYPSPASVTLNFLNLSSNKITDAGAKALAKVLRPNRQLYYLNLANNRITDVGCNEILNTLVEFHLTANEMIAMKHDHIVYLKDKCELINGLVQDMVRESDNKKSKTNKKDFNTTTKKGKSSPKDAAAKTVANTNNNPIDLVDPIFYQRAEILAQQYFGKFIHPYNEANTVSKNGLLYSKGNNILCYLNMAYNDLSYLSVKKLIAVIEYQRTIGRSPLGLITVSIEGNLMPDSCDEMRTLDAYLQAGIMFESTRASGPYKRRQSIKPK